MRNGEDTASSFKVSVVARPNVDLGQDLQLPKPKHCRLCYRVQSNYMIARPFYQVYCLAWTIEPSRTGIRDTRSYLPLGNCAPCNEN